MISSPAAFAKVLPRIEAFAPIAGDEADELC
jgi:hypothetical protein